MTENPSPQCILLVDDNSDDRFLAIRELRQVFPQIQVEEAIDADEFAKALEANCFDLVITDYQLRWTNGLEIMRRVKARDNDCPVVMLTNLGTQEIVVEAMKAGLDDYVIKSSKHLIGLSQTVHSVWERCQNRRKATQLDIRLESLLARLHVGVFRYTVDGQLLEVNQAFLELLGLESQAAACYFINQHPYLFAGERSAGQQWEREVQLRCGDGRQVWVLLNESCMPWNDTLVVDSLLEDITARKQAQVEREQLNQMLERQVWERTAQLEATNKELTAFAHSISHDLQSPIRQLNGFVKLLDQHLGASRTNEKSCHYLQVIAQLTTQIGRMVDDLVGYSCTGQISLHCAPVDMNRLVDEIKQKIELEIQGREISWQIQSLPSVWGDHHLLRLVWQNLMENAVKYTRTRRLAEITIGSFQGEGETIFFVRDNGIGFDMHYVGKLFGVFQRLHGNQQFEGTGVGLANVQRIIYRHGGRVWAEGVIDSGATFYFSLPKENQNKCKKGAAQLAPHPLIN